MKPRRSQAPVMAAAAVFLVLGSCALGLWWRPSSPEEGEGAPGATRTTRSVGTPRVSVERTALTKVRVDSILSGHVHDRTGRAIPDAIVCARPERCPGNQLCAEERCATTSEAGGYEIQGLSAGRIEVNASAAGHTPAVHANPILLAAGQSRRGIDLVLEPVEITITGTVIDAIGGVVAGASVQQSSDRRGQVRSRTVSDEQGRFVLPVHRGVAMLLATAEGYSSTLVQLAAPARDVIVSLLPEARISGRVVEVGTDRGVPGAVVDAAGTSYDLAGQRVRTETGSDGSFTLTGLRPGRYGLSARGERWRSGGPRVVDVEMAGAQLDVVLEVEPSLTLRGKLVMGDGPERCPVWGKVSLVPRGRGRARGEPFESQSRVPPGEDVVLTGVRLGTYEVYVFCASYPLLDGPKAITVADAPVEDVVWRFAQAATVTVRVRDGRGALLPDVKIQAVSKADPPTVSDGCQTEADGSCDLVGLAPGRYEVTAGLTGEQPSAGLYIADGQRRAEVELAAEGSASILVTATTPAGEPFSTGAVIAEGHGAGKRSSIRQHARPLGDGQYLFHPIPPGEYAITVFDGANPPVDAAAAEDRERVVVGPNESVELAVTYGGYSGEVTGLVVDERGEPVVDAWAEATAMALAGIALPHLQKNRIYTDTDGQFTLSRLREGSAYDIEVGGPGGSVVHIANVLPGKSLKVVLPEPGELGGTLVDARGVPAAEFGIKVTSLDTGAVRHEMFRGTRGRWTVRGVTPGRIEIEGRVRHQHAEQQLQLRPAESRLDLALVMPEEPLAAHAAGPTPAPVTPSPASPAEP